MNNDLKKWCDKSESIGTQLSSEYFDMQVGLKYSKSNISKLEKQNIKHSELFLRDFKKPKELYLANIDNVASSKTYKLLLQLHEARKKKIVSSKHKLGNKKVNWSTWRQFVAKADDKSRKQVFDEFITKTPLISSLIKKRFDKFREIHEKYNSNPLDSYLFEHKMNLNQLKDVLLTLQQGINKTFRKQFSVYTNKFLDRDPEYYDDFYFMRNIIYNDLTNGFKNVNALQGIKKTLNDMSLDSSNIHVDNVDRAEKYPSPFAQFVQIPNDIRISYKMENPLNTAIAIYHEMGHAIHASSIKQELPYWTRYLLSNGLAETFSIFHENLLSNEDYLVSELKLDHDYAREFIRRTVFVEIYSIAFYTANSLFKIKYWEKDLSFEDCDKEYESQLKKSFGMNIPGAYWQLHHILPESTMYVPSYMLAMINAHNIKDKLDKKFGSHWWKDKKAGKFMLGIMSPGADSKFADFSKIKANEFIKHIVREI